MSCCGGRRNNWVQIDEVHIIILQKTLVRELKLHTTLLVPLSGNLESMWALAELYADLFSRHAIPSKVYVFVAVDDRSEDEICRRCNGKQLRRRRGGRSVQLPNWFMIQHSFRDIYAHSIRSTYFARPKIFGESTPRRSGLGMDM